MINKTRHRHATKNTSHLGLLRWAGRSVGAALLVIAAGVLVITVDVYAGGRFASCGSGWNVVAGRSG